MAVSRRGFREYKKKLSTYSNVLRSKEPQLSSRSRFTFARKTLGKYGVIPNFRSTREVLRILVQKAITVSAPPCAYTVCGKRLCRVSWLLPKRYTIAIAGGTRVPRCETLIYSCLAGSDNKQRVRFTTWRLMRLSWFSMEPMTIINPASYCKMKGEKYDGLPAC